MMMMSEFQKLGTYHGSTACFLHKSYVSGGKNSNYISAMLIIKEVFGKGCNARFPTPYLQLIRGTPWHITGAIRPLSFFDASVASVPQTLNSCIFLSIDQDGHIGEDLNGHGIRHAT